MFKKTMLLGILGMLIIITALISSSPSAQRVLFFVGAVLMTSMAVLEKHRLFTALQIVILSGTAAAFLGVSQFIEGVIPLLVSIPVLCYLYKKSILTSNSQFLGATALIILGIGYATQSLLIFFVSGLLICIFSFLELRSGFKPAIIWFILNLIFTLVSAAKLFLLI